MVGEDSLLEYTYIPHSFCELRFVSWMDSFCLFLITSQPAFLNQNKQKTFPKFSLQPGPG